MTGGGLFVILGLSFLGIELRLAIIVGIVRLSLMGDLADVVLSNEFITPIAISND